MDLVGVVGDVAHDGEQVLGDAADDLAVHEGRGGRIAQLDLDAAVLLLHLDVEIGVTLGGGARVVGVAAGGEHGQGAAAQQVALAAGGGVAQARHLVAGKDVQAAARGDAGVGGGGKRVAVVLGHARVMSSVV